MINRTRENMVGLWSAFSVGCLLGGVIGLVSLLGGAIGPEPSTSSVVGGFAYGCCFPVNMLVAFLGFIPLIGPLLQVTCFYLFPLVSGLVYGGMFHLVAIAVRRIGRKGAQPQAAGAGKPAPGERRSAD